MTGTANTERNQLAKLSVNLTSLIVLVRGGGGGGGGTVFRAGIDFKVVLGAIAPALWGQMAKIVKWH